MAKINLDLIQLPVWNSRLADPMLPPELEETKNLAESFKADGQIQPIEVEEIGNGSFLLVLGNRRRCAAKLAGWTEIEATVRPPSTDNERMIRNIIENVKRKNLTSYEEARACAQMRKAGMSLKDVSVKLGFSVPKVSNLAVTFDTLPEPIIKEWRENNPVATNEFLRDLATDKKYPTAEEKMKAWDERVRVLAEREADAAAGVVPENDADETEPGAEASGTSGFSVSQKRLGWLVEVLTSKKSSPDLKDDVRNGYRALLAYVIQQRETPPEGVPAMPVKVKPVPLTEEEKAVKKAKAQADAAQKKAAELALKAAELASGKVPAPRAPQGNGKKAPLALAPQAK
jgi:ParB/RepB/Spo0J family partition protein